MHKTVIIIDEVHPIIPDSLTESGFSIIDGTKWNRTEIIARVKNAIGLVIRSRIQIDKEILDSGPNLKFIARVGAGMESIDTDYCNTKGVTCLNSPEGNRDAVGEHAIGMLLNLLNNLNCADKQVKSGKWNRESNRGFELSYKTIGIIGYGNMGSSFAKKLSVFGCNVISYDKYKTNYSDNYTKEVSLKELMNQADVISLHVPLTEETKFMINQDFIKNMSKSFYLINTARGPVVNTSSLVKAIESGKILGAALDVLEYEETSFEATKNLLDIDDFKSLSNFDNVILSPHIAGWTYESKIKLAEVLVNKIINLNL
mgnify:CR=1 FL=1